MSGLPESGPASNTSVTSTSNDPAGTCSRVCLASPTRTRSRPRGCLGCCQGCCLVGSACRTSSASAASISTASCVDRGLVAATYRRGSAHRRPDAAHVPGGRAGAARSTRCPSRRMYSKSRYSGSSRSTCDCGVPSSSNVHARGRSGSATSSATPESTCCRMSPRTAGALAGVPCHQDISPTVQSSTGHQRTRSRVTGPRARVLRPSGASYPHGSRAARAEPDPVRCCSTGPGTTARRRTRS